MKGWRAARDEWRNATQLPAWSWTQMTTSGTNLLAYPTSLAIQPAPPSRDEGPLDWLRHQIEEITELAA